MSEEARAEHDSPVTLINVVEMPAEHVDGFITQWQRRAAVMSSKPGFIDSRLHRALSTQARFQLVNVAHWTSREAWQAARDDPEFRELIRTMDTDHQLTAAANPALYQAAVTYTSAAPGEPNSASTAPGD